MQRLTEEQFKNMYGEAGVQMFKSTTTAHKPGFGERLKETFKSGFNKGVEGLNEIGEMSDPNSSSYERNPIKAVGKFVSGIGKTGSGVTQAASSPVIAGAQPVLEPTIGKAIDYTADKISNIPAVQRFANSKAGEMTSNVAQTVSDYNDIAGFVAGSKTLTGAPKIGNLSNLTNKTQKVGQVVDNVASKTGRLTDGAMGNLVKDVVPTADRFVNHQVTKALNLTANDVKNIASSTGNEVGQWMAEKNLIKPNLEQSMAAVDDLYKNSYQRVRSEIDAVKTIYKQSQTDGYVEALKILKKNIDDVPGLVKDSVEIDNLLNKKQLTLGDVQKVKELVDEHLNLYDASGNVKQGIAKEGIVNVRSRLQNFIENEVKNNNGADIRALNNDVQTAQSIMRSVKARSTSGLTKANLKISDLGIFAVGSGLGFGNPLVGLAALFGKKLLEAPAIRLRIAQFVDTLSDARKAKIKAQLEAGKIPDDLQQFVKMPPGGKGYGPGAMVRGELEHAKRGTVSIKNLVTHEDAPDVSRIEMYKNNLEAKQPVEPIKIVRGKNGKFEVEDGKHRLAAYKELGYERIPAELLERGVKINNYQKPKYTQGKDGRFTGSSY